MHLNLHVRTCVQWSTRASVRTDYFKSVSAEEHIATSFRPFNLRVTVYSYQ